MAAQIPPELIEMLRERRVIPFVGAGFSATLGMPDWDTMLRMISSEVQGAPPYDEIKRCCQGDHLQIAEYFFLKYDKSIGPIRHRLAGLLQPKHQPLFSAAHVELVNLNAQQIYTTNYDEAIEQTYQQLEHHYSFVALPKHIALADRSKPQVVKYHGDLRYDSTLVLTESSYYSRLEFESPMDLKFRSDLLGRSVLFIGYSFRDINIRIIWFKLMEMMKDVPETDRPSSFVVRFENNEVLEELYKAVGIRTLYLDKDNKAKTHEERTKLLEAFMVDLSFRVNEGAKMPGTDTQMYMSTGILGLISESVNRRSPPRHTIPNPRSPETLLMRHAALRVIPRGLSSRVDDVLRLLPRRHGSDGVALLLSYFTQGFSGPGAAVTAMKLLLREGTRNELLGSATIPWATIWTTKVSLGDAEYFISVLDSEVQHHNQFGPDLDLAYAADLTKRVQTGMIVSPLTNELQLKASEALKRASKVYPAVEAISPTVDGPPQVDELVREIQATIPAETEPVDDDIPF